MLYPARRELGPIPAHAGEPTPGTGTIAYAGAYPRSRGGTYQQVFGTERLYGLSPLTRGNPPVPLIFQ